MKPSAAAIALLMGLAATVSATSAKPPQVEVAHLRPANWSQFAPQGKELDAIGGDIVLRNQHLVAVIARPEADRHANMTVENVAGCLIDLSTRKEQSDQLSAFYPSRRKFPFRWWSTAVDGKTVAFDSSAVHAGQSASVTVRSENEPTVKVTYRLQAGQPYLTVTTKFTNTGDEPLSVPLSDDIRADGGKEDMAKAADGTSKLFWIHDRFWNQAYGVVAEGAKIDSDSNSHTSVLKYLPTKRQSADPSVRLDPGESYELSRRVIPGRNLLDVKAVVAELRDQDALPVELTVTNQMEKPIPQARVRLSQDGKLFGSAQTDSEGFLKTRLPGGEYGVKIATLGQAFQGKRSFSIAAEKPEKGVLFELHFQTDYKPGTVKAAITDEKGNPIPCKVEFTGKGGTPTPDFGPETAAFGVENLRYAPKGRFTQQLPDGEYDVIVSHGPEYDALFTELTVEPGKTVPLTGELVRSVDTTGWVSSDFHSHSSPSGDNTASQFGRVINLLCEHVEFAPCTEHNRLSTYKPHIERLGVGQWIATTTGIELTGNPLPLNHQNAFPLKLKPHTQDNGAPQTHRHPEMQIERLALWDGGSEKLVQQNHPDIGWLFYDRNGDGQRDKGYENSFGYMDAIEIHPVPHALHWQPHAPGGDRHNRIFNWLQLLNQGFRIPGVINTDAHYNYHGSGGRRNWIASPTDDPAKIDTMEMVHAAEAGKMIISNGPFLEVALRENVEGCGNRVTAGADLAPSSGQLSLEVRVQCPNWFDIDHVFLLVNGRKHPEHDYTREADPDRFSGGTVKFDEQLLLNLEEDAHLIVVAGGEKTTLGPVMGPRWGSNHPTALSNPIFVDVDGGGFQANGDTLGHPLPVKFGTKQK